VSIKPKPPSPSTPGGIDAREFGTTSRSSSFEMLGAPAVSLCTSNLKQPSKSSRRRIDGPRREMGSSSALQLPSLMAGSETHN
jgi:hypothetical protein